MSGGGIWLKLIEVEVRRGPDGNSLRGMPVNPASPNFSLFSAFAFLLFLSHMRSSLGGVEGTILFPRVFRSSIQRATCAVRR